MTSDTTMPTWLITGTSNGFGLALAQLVLNHGHNLMSISRYSEAHSTLNELASFGSRKHMLYHLQHDLSNPDESVIKTTITNFLSNNPEVSVDILVNNAGVAALAPLETIPTSTISHVMTVNYWSPLWIIQAILPHMRQSDNRLPKVICNISSTQGLVCDPSEIAYETSKHALEALSGVLAAEVLPFGIRTISANLGSFRTAFATSGARAGLQDSGKKDDEADGGVPDAYAAPHPVGTRIDMVTALAKVEGMAKGDPAKGAEIVFDAIMRAEGSEVDKVMEKQRVAIRKDKSVSKLERLVLGSDAQPKLERQLEFLRLQIESCRAVSSLTNADDVK